MKPRSMNRCNILQLPAVGDKIKLKQANTIRFYSENFNGIHSELWEGGLIKVF